MVWLSVLLSQVFLVTLLELRSGICTDTKCSLSDKNLVCQTGWHLADRECVKVVTKRQNWTEAMTTCQNENARLVRYNEEKYSCLKDAIPKGIEALWINRTDNEQSVCYVVRLNETDREKALACFRLRLFLCGKNSNIQDGLELKEDVKEEETDLEKKEETRNETKLETKEETKDNVKAVTEPQIKGETEMVTEKEIEEESEGWTEKEKEGEIESEMTPEIEEVWTEEEGGGKTEEEREIEGIPLWMILAVVGGVLGAIILVTVISLVVWVVKGKRRSSERGLIQASAECDQQNDIIGNDEKESGKFRSES